MAILCPHRDGQSYVALQNGDLIFPQCPPPNSTMSLSWLVNKSTLLKAIELLNIILFANNHQQDGVLQQKKELSKWGRVEVESFSSGGLKNVESSWRLQQIPNNIAVAENLALGVQIIVAIMQFTVAYQYYGEIQDFNEHLSYFNIGTDTKVSNKITM